MIILEIIRNTQGLLKQYIKKPGIARPCEAILYLYSPVIQSSTQQPIPPHALVILNDSKGS
jgi:hypothetical protein